MKKELTNNRGITLIALVITIIILLILAGVSIGSLFNADGLFSRANTAAKLWNDRKEEEGDYLGNIVNDIDRIIKKPPVPRITIPEPNGENGWHNTEDVTIIIDDGEPGISISSVNKITYTLDGVKTEVEGRTATVRIDTDGIHKIKAYSSNSRANSDETEEYTIKRDVADPNKITLEKPTEVTISSFKIEAKAQDLTSGIKKIKFELSKAEDFNTIVDSKEYTEETPTTEETSIEHEFTGLNDGTPYYTRAIVEDEAGRTSTSSTVAQNTVLANTAPSKAKVSFNTKGTNYIKVNAKSEDVDGDKLTYTLRYGTSASSLTGSAELSDQTPNVEVPIQTPTDLYSYTYYYWRVDVTDGIVTTEGDVQAKVRTYCPGTGYTCISRTD